MSVSAIFILDSKGKVLISRDYRGDVALSAVERFVSKLLEEDELLLTPVLEDDGVTYVYLRHKNLYLLAVTQHNANAAIILLFLYRLVAVFTDYFKSLEEESIRDNFVLIYELLDETCDFGYPQLTETSILQEYITQQSHKLVISSKPATPHVPAAATGAVSWRAENIFYKKNEVFLDVVERVNLLAAANGTVLRSEIVGAVKMRSYLSGMPELRLGLNDRVQFERSQRKGKGKTIEMEDVAFHQCVRLSRFETDRTISFIPPDKDFDLMTYRLRTQVKPLIWIEALVDSHKHSRIEYLIKARSQFKTRSTATNVNILIPVPPDADTPKFKATIGTVKYAPEKDCIVWTIKQFQGAKEYLMRAHFGLPSLTAQDDEAVKRPPIQVQYEIPYFTVSGIQVRYLKIIEKSGYQALPWVRYITASGDYQIRMA